MKLKTLKDIGLDDVYSKELRKEAKKYLKELYINCSYCGKRLVHDYEGELSCPDFWDDWHKNECTSKHDGLVGSGGDLDTANFIIKFFNLE